VPVQDSGKAATLPIIRLAASDLPSLAHISR
jgi:hypothetical protein